MIDFGSLVGAVPEVVDYDLEKFYGALDVKKSHTEPRTAQREAMKALTERHAERDLILKANTGAGKTTVGLLYLYGFMRVAREPVVFVCPTTQLIDQVLEEAQRLGIKAWSYPAGDPIPNQECVRGDAVLVCTYEKMFNAKTTFARYDVNLVPHAIVFDDAHAGVENIRKQFTLKIEGEPFEKIKNVFAARIKNYSRTSWIDIDNRDENALLEIPHWLWTDSVNELVDALHGHANDLNFKFVWPFLSDKLRLCRCVISGSSAEITPEILPVDLIRAYSQASHRLFMSATLADDSLLTRELNVDRNAAINPIVPPSDQGLGERMILAPSLVDTTLDREYVMNLSALLAGKHNVVVLTSSGSAAQQWVVKGAQYFVEANFAEGVRKLKDPHSGLKFAVFAQRFDGVDLPDDACRVLVIDGVPYGEGLVDKVDASLMLTSGGARNRTIFRIEQGMGRAVRSHADFAVVLLAGQELASYVGKKDVLKGMTFDSQNQLKLGSELAEMVAKSGAPNADVAIRAVIDQCLLRDAGWKAYYNKKVREVAKKTVDIERSRIDLAYAERRAYDLAFQNNSLAAKDELDSAINSAKLHEEELGVLLQRTARIVHPLNPVEAMKLQRSARSKNLSVSIPPEMPRRLAPPKAVNCAEKMCAWLNTFSSLNAAVLEVKSISDSLDFSQHYKKVESALKKLGEALGADSSRPEEEINEGPDNLWFWGNLGLVIEAKSGNEKSLHKKDSGQIHDSLQWARNTYPNFADRFQPIVAASVSLADKQAHYPAGTRVLTQNGCAEMGRALHQLVLQLATIGPVFAVPDHVLSMMTGLKLHPDQFILSYTVPLENS